MKENGRLALSLAFLDFLALGLFSAVLGVAWPSIRDTFTQPLDAMGWLLAMGTVGTLAASAVSGRLVARLGLGYFLLLANMVSAAGMIGFALAPGWWTLVLFGLVIGLGTGALHAGLNNAITLRYHARHVSWLHFMFALGATVGPVLLTAFLLSGQTWPGWYLIGAGVLAAFGLVFAWSAGSWPATRDGRSPGRPDTTALVETIQLPMTWISLGLFFMYTGLEITAGQWSFSLLTESRAIPTALAGTAVSLFWGGLAVGRVVVGALGDRVNLSRLVSGALGLALVACILYTLPGPPALSVAALALLGLALSPLYPLMMATTGRRVGASHASNVIGLQVSAGAIGMAAIPAMAGVLADAISLEILGPLLVAAALMLAGLFRLAGTRERRQEAGSLA